MNNITDDELLFDMLSIENEAVKAYSIAMINCTTATVHESVLDILCDQHQICLDIKDELSKRGFIDPIQSKSDEIKAVVLKFKQ